MFINQSMPMAPSPEHKSQIMAFKSFLSLTLLSKSPYASPSNFRTFAASLLRIFYVLSHFRFSWGLHARAHLVMWMHIRQFKKCSPICATEAPRVVVLVPIFSIMWRHIRESEVVRPSFISPRRSQILSSTVGWPGHLWQDLSHQSPCEMNALTTMPRISKMVFNSDGGGRKKYCKEE